MQQHTQQTFTAAHTWLGIIAGILLFIVTFSGFPALFSHELENWQSPALNKLKPVSEIDLDRLLIASDASDFGKETFFIVPEMDKGYARIAHFNEGKDEFDMRYIELWNYQTIDIGSSEVAHIFEYLHTDLHLPRPFGRYLVGLAGMVMLLSIIAGIVIHTKWRKAFVMLRPKRSWRLLLTDQHKLLGLWTLPFSFILAFTGTILGLLGIISPILALAKFDGDVGKATIAVLGPRAEVTEQAAPAVSLNDLKRQAKTIQPELDTTFIQVDGYGDAGGLIKFSGNHRSSLSNLQSVTFSLADGQPVHELNAADAGPFQRIFAAVTPLHYVLFGDMGLKVFYALSTLALCALIISGNMIWLEKKKQTAQQPEAENIHFLGRLTLGVCAGLVFSCAMTLSASQWLHGFDLPTGTPQHHIEESVFWATWVMAAIGAFIGNNLHTSMRIYLAITAVALLSVLVADGMINKRYLISGNDIVTGVHTALIALTLVCGYFSWRLPKSEIKPA